MCLAKKQIEIMTKQTPAESMRKKALKTNAKRYKIFKRNQNILGFMNVILLHNNHQHRLSHSCGHLQGGENKNTHKIIICQNHSTLKNHMVFVKNIYFYYTTNTTTYILYIWFI